MTTMDYSDLEKHVAVTEEKNAVDEGVAYGKRPSYVDEDGGVPGESFEIGDTIWARMQRFAGRFNIEQRGIERVPESERSDTSILNVATMWLSANLVISSFAIGVLASQVFYLGFVDAILVTLFFNLLGVIPVCFYSAFGPVFGLRQMVLSRFWFGWWGVKVIAVFNIIACVGWSSVNSIVAAQFINTVNSDVPGWAGILIVAFCTLFVVMFGYKIVHIYEFWSWLPVFIIMMIIVGEFAHSGAFVNVPMGVGASELGSCLSYGAVVYGFATGWVSYAADYTVYQPKTVGKQKVFWWTWIGLIPPLLFTQFLGVACATAIQFQADGQTPNIYMQGYMDSKVGGLIGAILRPRLGHFGDFCLVILALSTIANNCPNIYSVSLTVQVLGRYVQRVPRFLWTVVATLVYIGISIPGYSHFEAVLDNFMSFIGYWLAAYEGISLMEHFVFRRGFSGYDASHYDQAYKLPVGLAAIIAFCAGMVGMVCGMSQVWFVGFIARHVGAPPFGGDIGFELAFGFAMVTYLALRPIEKSFFGR